MAAGQQMLLNLGSFGFVAADTPYGQQHFKVIAWSYKASVWGWEMVKLAAGIVNQMQQFAFCFYLDPVVVGAAVLQAATFFFLFCTLYRLPNAQIQFFAYFADGLPQNLLSYLDFSLLAMEQNHTAEKWGSVFSVSWST